MNNIVLVGNPNVGKTSLFNQLTGLNQKVGNYHGVTVDKRTGGYNYKKEQVTVTDLPGIYSLYPGSEDERIAVAELIALRETQPLLIVVVDLETPQKNLLLLDQLVDFGIPVMGVLNVHGKHTQEEENRWIDRITSNWNISVVPLNAQSGEGVETLKERIFNWEASKEVKPTAYSQQIETYFEQVNAKAITKDLSERLQKIDQLSVSDVQPVPGTKLQTITERLDRWIMHPILGYCLFGLVLMMIFQAVFSWSAYPMDAIDAGVAGLSEWLAANLPGNYFTRALTDGLIPGLGGVVIFIPQIAFLFLFISLFEESGYMSRVVYLMDRLVRPFGLSGKSIVPLISGYACAIPAIMATRTIKHPREKLITLLVVPFMTCSARIPVYATLIALLVPAEAAIGIFNLQGLILLAMYVFGAVMSFVTALIFNRILKGGGRSGLVLELPEYKMPPLRNIGVTIYEKCQSFVLQAGKIILAVSLILYFLGNIGFSETYQKIEDNDPEFVAQYSGEELSKMKLEHSLMGQMGKFIEPVIQPLGYDWKIGISLIASFAAREVFVGTLSTIYALEATDDEVEPIVEKMRGDTHSNGAPIYSLGVILSLLVFYALAMQCVSTLAIVKKETGGWKWPTIQFAFSTGSAYLLALLVYQLF